MAAILPCSSPWPGVVRPGAALWKRDGSRALNAYLIATIVLLFAMVPIMSGMTGLDTNSFRGLFQRIFALTVFPPIGVGAYVLAMRIRSPRSNLDPPPGAIDVSTAAPIDGRRRPTRAKVP